MDRRKFIRNSTKQISLISIAGLSATSSLATRPDPDKHNLQNIKETGKIIYRVLGRTGITLPVVSMGVMNANNPGLVRGAWDAGMRMFDTAWNYQNGNNERMVGSVLRELKVNREQAVIATKVLLPDSSIIKGKERGTLFLQIFDESLSRLRMDYVDILYYHDAQSIAEINDPFIIEAFIKLKESKKIRFTGFSTHTYWPTLVTDAANRKFYDVILLSYNYSMFRDQRIFDALKLASQAGIGLVAMKTQCQQGWYKRGVPVEQQKYYEGTLMNSALLKWALQSEYITTAVPGFTNFQQLDEDIAVAYDLTFTKDEEEFFNSREIQLAIQSVCRHCGYCIFTCPQNADIPSLMRTHMYSLSYGNPLMAKQTLERILPGKGIDACKNCDICSGKCRFRVPIADRINELKEII
ncbi:MAG: aldo/keto reductase [Bacteroidales bacterium]|nr:aldo/keto reductase [Bacteroidales bacterium]